MTGAAPDLRASDGTPERLFLAPVQDVARRALLSSESAEWYTPWYTPRWVTDAARAAGECRFTAPTMMGWPTTKAGSWCGEWSAPRTQAQQGEPVDATPAPAARRIL